MSDIVLTHMPGGSWAASGGTRTQVKLSRPWQPPFLETNQASCPFCTKPQQELISPNENWKVLQNLFTPFPRHNLIIPKTCSDWDEKRTYELGGAQMIVEVMTIAGELNRDNTDWRILSVHVGALAGQNLAHLHWHDVAPIGVPMADQYIMANEVLEYAIRCDNVCFLKNEYCRSILGGHRAGQCFIVPNPRQSQSINTLALARMIFDLISLYADRFKSSDKGLPPEYTIGMCFEGQEFRYATYVPILNQMGATEYLALLEPRSICSIHPWTPQNTYQHLTGKECV